MSASAFPHEIILALEDHQYQKAMELIARTPLSAANDMQRAVFDYVVAALAEDDAPVRLRDRLGEVSESYRRGVECHERPDYCRAKICRFSNPSCAGEKDRLMAQELVNVLQQYRPS